MLKLTRLRHECHLLACRVESWTMDSESDDLPERITARLQEKGPATLDTLASELSASQWIVQSCLEELQKEGSVRLLFGGLWDAHWKPPETKSVAEE
jgi:hypothetical protein